MPAARTPAPFLKHVSAYFACPASAQPPSGSAELPKGEGSQPHEGAMSPATALCRLAVAALTLPRRGPPQVAVWLTLPSRA